MSSEAISAGIMITGAVIAATFLVAAILPAIFTAGGTFGTVAHSTDNQIRTDFEIIRAFTSSKIPEGSENSPVAVDVWIKNTGQIKFNRAEIELMDVFFGNYEGITRLTYTPASLPLEGSFTFTVEGSDSAYWNPGDTLHIKTSRTPTLKDPYYFGLATLNGIQKTHVFGNTSPPGAIVPYP